MKRLIRKIFSFIFILTLAFAMCTPNISYAKKNSDLGKCDVSKYIEDSQKCFSCNVVATIVSTFMKACSKGYGLMRDAGNTLLGIFSVLWIALFVIKQVSSFSEIEIMEMLQTFGIFLFKVLVAFLCLNNFGTIKTYTMDPIISFGTDFGTALLTISSAETLPSIGQIFSWTEVFYA